MNLIEVTGGNKYQRELAEKTVAFCIKELLPRFRTLDITIKLRKLPEGNYGYCMMGDNNREFELEINRDLPLKDFITTLTHEMVHVKQYARKEMDANTMRWKKGRVAQGTDYMDLPWEKEAYRLEDKLALKLWNANIL
jgi:hypothetical protein